MADNLKLIEERIDVDIDPTGAPGSILAENHNEIEKEILRKSGKYTGSPFTAKKQLSVFPSGTLSWNSNAMNNVSEFTITTSKLTSDLTDFGKVLETMGSGDLIQFKDYSGRTVFLEFQSFTPGTDTSSNAVYNVAVKGFAENLNYTYQINETATAVLSMVKKLVDISTKVDKNNPIIAGVFTKITYDEKGLVTGGADAGIADITGLQGGLDSKLNSADYNDRFKGVYPTFLALNSAFPTANAGDSAQVNEVGATDVVNYSWDAEESIWVQSGSAGSGATNTDALPEGSSNLYWTTARGLSLLLTGLSVLTGGTIVSTDSVLIAFGKIQKQINDNVTAIGLKGDMTTTTDQPVSGVKTFLAGKFGFRNVANTFTSFFTNANTASRTYTFQNRDGTVADLTDIAGVNTGKMNTPAGTVNYLSKFLTASTIGISRFFDDGTYFGLGTANAPTKDFTLGNQGNRVVGVEESANTSPGRDLDIEAGRTINFVPNVNFNALNQTFRTYQGITVAPNGNVYVGVDNGDIYMQTNGSGNFAPLGQTLRRWYGLAVAPNGNVYACDYTGSIYMQTGGVGSFVSLAQTFRFWYTMCSAPNGNIYAIENGGDIYMQTNGTGNFVALGQTNRNWRGITVAPNGNIYATVASGDIYMQTNGTGNFVALGQVIRTWRGVTASSNGNIYASDNGGDIYMQTNGTGNFVALGQTLLGYQGMAFSPNGNVYVVVTGGDIYMQNNNTLGTANLDGGTQRTKAGTGKGTGKSRLEGWTGQKTTSGTDMQVLTKRYEYDENGHYTLFSIPTYADNASAISGGLTTGKFYRTSTGVLMIVY
jgi:hypothetical protein